MQHSIKNVATKTAIALGLLASSTIVSLADETADWSGVYWGLFVGTGTAESQITGNRFTYDSGASVNRVNHDFSGNTAGGIIGFNYQFGQFVAGLELELAATDFDSHKVFNSDNDIDQVDINWYGVAAARAGFAIDQTLIYGKAGLAFAEFYNIGGDMDASGFDREDAHIRTEVLYGYALGGGVEHAINQNTSLRLEYLYMDFEDYTQANNDPAVPQQKYKVENGPIETVKLAVTFKF